MIIQDLYGDLSNKRKATSEELAMYRPTESGQQEIAVGDMYYRLDREDKNDELDVFEQQLAEADNPYWDDDLNTPESLDICPDFVDHRPKQTSVKDQFDRGTCVAFASIAALEAVFTEEEGRDINLSEQYAFWQFMLGEGRNQCDNGLRTTRAALYLSQSGVCEESYAPYEKRATVEQHCMAAPSNEAQKNAIYKIQKYAIIDRLGPFGPSIANTAYLESLLCHGYDIVLGTHVAWGRPDSNKVHDVLLDRYGNPLKSRGGHAMLIVGYNRGVSLPYFILKNSWGSNAGNNGYYYLSHDYIRYYAKYGYIVQSVTRDIPT